MKTILNIFWFLLISTSANATVIDITEILKAHNIDAKLSREAPGNEGSAYLEYARINLANGQTEAKIRMKYKHVWKGKILGIGWKTKVAEKSFNVWGYGHIVTEPGGICTIHLDRVTTSNDLLKAVRGVADIFIRVFSLGENSINRIIQDNNFDCSI